METHGEAFQFDLNPYFLNNCRELRSRTKIFKYWIETFKYCQQTAELHSLAFGFAVTFLNPPNGKSPCSHAKVERLSFRLTRVLSFANPLSLAAVLYSPSRSVVFISGTFPLGFLKCRRRSWRPAGQQLPSWNVLMSSSLLGFRYVMRGGGHSDGSRLPPLLFSHTPETSEMVRFQLTWELTGPWHLDL